MGKASPPRTRHTALDPRASLAAGSARLGTLMRPGLQREGSSWYRTDHNRQLAGGKRLNQTARRRFSSRPVRTFLRSLSDFDYNIQHKLFDPQRNDVFKPSWNPAQQLRQHAILPP